MLPAETRNDLISGFIHGSTVTALLSLGAIGTTSMSGNTEAMRNLSWNCVGAAVCALAAYERYNSADFTLIPNISSHYFRVGFIAGLIGSTAGPEIARSLFTTLIAN